MSDSTKYDYAKAALGRVIKAMAEETTTEESPVSPEVFNAVYRELFKDLPSFTAFLTLITALCAIDPGTLNLINSGVRRILQSTAIGRMGEA